MIFLLSAFVCCKVRSVVYKLVVAGGVSVLLAVTLLACFVEPWIVWLVNKGHWS